MPSRRRSVLVPATVLVAALSAAAGGCQVVGSILHVAFGPPSVDAKYDPQKRPTLVLVENYQDQDASPLDGDAVARRVGDALHKNADLDVVDPDKVTPLRAEHPADFRLMTIPDVGKAVGADQVVYVNLIESQTTSDPTGAAVHATAIARIRVVDCKTGNLLWPAGTPKGFELTANRDFDRSDSPQGAAMRTELLDRLSGDIAKLFYKWKPETEQESNEAG